MRLLYKELTLAAHPTSIVFAFLGCLVIVPAYPYTVIFMFGCLALYLTLLYARETNDTWYTSILPVTKRENVKGKFLMAVSLQIFQLLISIPCLFLRHILILSRLVDTFFSRISLTMLPVPNPHNTVCVLS